MALKLYVLMMDVSNPSSFVDRYIVENSPSWSVVDGWSTNPYIGASNTNWATPAARQASRATSLSDQQRVNFNAADEQWVALLGRYGAADYTSATKFAASFYGEASTGQALPTRVRTFLGANPSKVNAFSHFADRELASFWARKAASKNLAQIAAMGGHEGIKAVSEMWDCVGKYFRAINVTPWSWSRFRNAIKVNIGTYSAPNDPDRGTSSSSHQHRLHLSNWGTPGFLSDNIGAEASRFAGLPERTGFLYQYEPSPVADKYPGRWRIAAARLMSSRFGRAISPQHLRFGAINDYAGRSTGGVEDASLQPQCSSVGVIKPPSEEFGIREKQIMAELACKSVSDEASGNRKAANDARRVAMLAAFLHEAKHAGNGCPHPSGDAHPMWMNSNGVAQDLFYGLIESRRIDPAVAVMQTNRTDFQNIFRRPWAVDDYSDAINDQRPDLIPIPPTNTSQWSWLSDAMMSGDWNVYLPPYLWYAKLLWPLVEYLQSKDPLEVIHEVKMDMIGKNLWTSTAGGNGTPDLSNSTPDISKMIVDSVFAIGAGIVSAFNPIAGAIVGAVGFAVSEIMEAAADEDAVLIDCFGRRFGTVKGGAGKSGILDYFMISSRYQSTQLPTAANELYFGMGEEVVPLPDRERPTSYTLRVEGFVDTPMPIAFRRPDIGLRGWGIEEWASKNVFSPSFASPDFVYDPSMDIPDSRLVIVGLPMDARVEIDGDDAQFGRWDDAARTRWSSPELNGDHQLKVTLPNGRSYSQTVFVPANRPAVVLYDVLSGKAQAIELQKREESKIPWPAIVIGGAAIVAAIYIVTKKDYPTTKNPRSRAKLSRRSR